MKESRRFIYGIFEVTVVGNEYYITNEQNDIKELKTFDNDVECCRYLSEMCRALAESGGLE